MIKFICTQKGQTSLVLGGGVWWLRGARGKLLRCSNWLVKDHRLPVDIAEATIC